MPPHSFPLRVSYYQSSITKNKEVITNMAEIEYAFLSLRVTPEEKEAIKKAANKENRSVANYLLNSALTRAQEQHDILPEYEDETVLKSE